MELLKRKILEEGEVIGEDILKVDSFLNHQLDIEFLNEVGREFWYRFKDEKVTRILTIESSGIAIAAITAQYFKVPVVFAKKNISRNLDTEIYTSEVFSFTKGTTYQIKVAKRYITSQDRILIIDDFLANGRAVLGLKDIIEQAGAYLVGVGIVIEKGFQQGGKTLREAGVNLHSLAIVDSMRDGKIVFR
ncbi:xanthine phosphoribosyltransferase [Thermosyntropha lipolytica DSM 11003]|uniref:Xanthine phosphoribosyltransferase n=1 Tax=Thermosyntropha lipolytica DSM 11003 TaxID=1123382 RepID=A0A1M5R972_9FIRM|nr:xanthine phosphoribosyltransferase [Thermosyntropha lipolytica]SHH22902.1 xanthine phosphoribosyltransferase [Thermosyntropha lipolytica DSM 11003]